MNAAGKTEAQDTAAKELGTGEERDGRKGTNKSDLEPPAAPTPAASGKRRGVSENASARKKASSAEKPEDGGKSTAAKKNTKTGAAAKDSGAGVVAGPDSGQSPPGAAVAGAAPAEMPPRRRGILPAARLDAAPGSADEAGSVSWMAAQAVKALNAVKASQIEQAQEWKARVEAEGGQVRLAEEDDFAAGVAEADAVPAESGPWIVAEGQAVTPPAGSSPDAAIPIPPAVARTGAARWGAPLRAILILGALAAIGLLGYRHWLAGEEAPSQASAPAETRIEPAGPAAGVDMTAPAISVVAVPVSAAGRAEPPSAATTTSPAPEPVAGVRATATQAINAPAPSPEPPAAAAAAMPEITQAPAPVAVMPPAVAGNPPATRSQEDSPPPVAPAAPAPAITATVAAKPSAPPAPAPRAQYPANGYGYYAPPSSWQPYYRPAYPQAPAR